ncbi:hypothetical protein F4813DRAFT_385381 [Daldinia decipiens]|uniref:uncharacterized protein n=1 Tax=Daldinia decipiens TaxID=326647 RepID=UPI0020C2D953|nr:uncharacterized protein F4813DRAFT_385381 [Daldinia decipiens]KAI1661703.1 hypothetical protein F4813DRAFT_385381 [Daldinia decipiens]
MAEVYCTCVIAYMEGRRPPPRSEMSSTLEALDKRARQLEATSQVTPPPPFTETTWDSLTWRVCRLSRLLPPAKALKKAPPLGNAASLSLLKGAISTISVQNQIPWSVDDDLEEKEYIKLAAQWLYFYAGQRNVEIRHPSFKFENVCSLALDLSLEAESGYPWNRRPIPPPGLMAPPMFNTQRARCCGCCSCSCHRNSRSRRDSSVSSDGSSHRSSRRGRWPVLGWFKRLAFWRRRRIADDSSSSSGTIVDD